VKTAFYSVFVNVIDEECAHSVIFSGAPLAHYKERLVLGRVGIIYCQRNTQNGRLTTCGEDVIISASFYTRVSGKF
jgi:hypothetical protein